MAIQIFGSNKCQATRAAVRFFKERRVPFHFVDLEQRGLSEGGTPGVLSGVSPSFYGFLDARLLLC